jgi:hypothetical protein
LPVPGKEWNPTEDLDTRRNGEPQMCAKLRECGIRVNLTAVVAILCLPPTRAFSQDELASTALPLQRNLTMNPHPRPNLELEVHHVIHDLRA